MTLTHTCLNVYQQCNTNATTEVGNVWSNVLLTDERHSKSIYP